MKEVDALGGVCAIACDQSGEQFESLSLSLKI
jgi:hypothetical protein